MHRPADQCKQRYTHRSRRPHACTVRWTNAMHASLSSCWPAGLTDQDSCPRVSSPRSHGPINTPGQGADANKSISIALVCIHRPWCTVGLVYIRSSIHKAQIQLSLPCRGLPMHAQIDMDQAMAGSISRACAHRKTRQRGSGGAVVRLAQCNNRSQRLISPCIYARLMPA